MKITLIQWCIISAFVFFLVLTVLAGKNHQPTVSNTLQDWGTKYNWFAFLFGALLGHWFFPSLPGPRVWPWLLIPMAALGAWDFVMIKWQPLPRHHWIRYPGLWVCLGIPSGAYVWASTW
jgi:hypothetical protein